MPLKTSGHVGRPCELGDQAYFQLDDLVLWSESGSQEASAGWLLPHSWSDAAGAIAGGVESGASSQAAAAVPGADLPEAVPTGQGWWAWDGAWSRLS